jgi:hypothetical protein
MTICIAPLPEFNGQSAWPVGSLISPRVYPKSRSGRQAAAIVRKMLAVVWNVLIKKAANQHADHNIVAKSMMQIFLLVGLRPLTIW